MTSETFDSEILCHKDKMYRYALSMVYNTEVAKDILQDVFLKLWSRREQITQVENKQAWCMKCVRNQVLDYLKSPKNQSKNLDAAPERRTDVTPESRLVNQDLLARIEKMLETLPDVQKEVFRLRDLMGHSYREIAEILEIPESRVKISLFRARTKIREEIKKTESYGLARKTG